MISVLHTTQKGFAKILVVAVVVLVLTALGGAYVLFTSESVEEISLDVVLHDVLRTDERAHGIMPENAVITRSVRQFVRGTVTDARTGEVLTFYALQIGDVWRIVDVVTGPVSCERFARLSFPSDVISDCVLTFDDAVTVAEIDATIDQELLMGTPLRVIGFVDSINEETGEITLQSGGATMVVSVQVSATYGLLQGDLIVVDVTELQNVSSGYDGSGTQSTVSEEAHISTVGQTGTTQTLVGTATTVLIVGAQDTELHTGISTTTPLPQENNTTTATETTNMQEAQSGVIHKIYAPHTTAPPSYFFNAYDVDNSFVDVRIDGDF